VFVLWVSLCRGATTGNGLQPICVRDSAAVSKMLSRRAAPEWWVTDGTVRL
jgi:hypothetical protein